MADEEIFTSGYIGNAYLVWMWIFRYWQWTQMTRFVHTTDVDILLRYSETYVMTICWSRVQGCYKWQWKEHLATWPSKGQS